MEITYNELYKMNKIEARKKIIQTYLIFKSYRKTALLFNTSRSIIKKIVLRYQKEGVSGLEDKSRRPHHCPRQISQTLESLILKYRGKTNMGRLELSQIIHREENISISPLKLHL